MGDHCNHLCTRIISSRVLTRHDKEATAYRRENIMFASMHRESQYLHYHGIRSNNLPNTVLLEDSWQLSFLHFLKGKVSRVLLKAWGSTIRWEHCIFRIIQVEEWFRKGVWRDREDWSYRSAGRKGLRTYHCPCYLAIVIRMWIQSAEKESLFQGWMEENCAQYVCERDHRHEAWECLPVIGWLSLWHVRLLAMQAELERVVESVRSKNILL